MRSIAKSVEGISTRVDALEKKTEVSDSIAAGNKVPAAVPSMVGGAVAINVVFDINTPEATRTNIQQDLARKVTELFAPMISFITQVDINFKR